MAVMVPPSAVESIKPASVTCGSAAGSKRPFGAVLVGARGLAPEGLPMPQVVWAGSGGCIGAP